MVGYCRTAFRKIRKLDHYLMNKDRLSKEQENLSRFVKIPEDPIYAPQKGDLILALDIQYKENQAHVAGDLHYWQQDHMGTFAGEIEAKVPYVPSYFCFREGPPLLSFWKTLQEKNIAQPKFIIVDGHGIAHPRKFGVACWLGLATQTPTIGCAKDTLVRYVGDLSPDKGSRVPVQLDEETVGYVFRKEENIRPIYVSPGHLTTLGQSIEIVQGLPGNYRIPDPLRNADHAARSHCKKIPEKTWKDLGLLCESQTPWEKTPSNWGL